MGIGDGPAAVIGDEHRIMPLSGLTGWEGAVIRVIRESENLPELEGIKFRGQELPLKS